MKYLQRTDEKGEREDTKSPKRDDEAKKTTIETMEEQRPASQITHRVVEQEPEYKHSMSFATVYDKQWLNSVNESLGLKDGFKIVQGRKKPSINF